MPSIHDFMDLTNESDEDEIVILPKNEFVRNSSLHSTSLHSRPLIAPQKQAASLPFLREHSQQRHQERECGQIYC